LKIVFFLFLSISVHALTLEIKVDNLENDNGVVGWLLFNKTEGFPEKHELSFKSGFIEAKDASESIKVPELDPGEYAIVLLHDLNRNKAMDKNFLGIPKEGFGFSNDPTIVFGPPSFDKCRFELKEDKKLVIKMKYF
jgi:uncharacterized protein (DUF2141 family)